MDSEYTILWVVGTIWVAAVFVLYFFIIKKDIKTYGGKIWTKKKVRTQPLAANTLNVGDALLFKEKWKWNTYGESGMVKVYYEVKERKPSYMVFIRKDKEEIVLPYKIVDELIADGTITDYN